MEACLPLRARVVLPRKTAPAVFGSDEDETRRWRCRKGGRRGARYPTAPTKRRKGNSRVKFCFSPQSSSTSMQDPPPRRRRLLPTVRRGVARKPSQPVTPTGGDAGPSGPSDAAPAPAAAASTSLCDLPVELLEHTFAALPADALAAVAATCVACREAACGRLWRRLFELRWGAPAARARPRPPTTRPGAPATPPPTLQTSPLPPKQPLAALCPPCWPSRWLHERQWRPPGRRRRWSRAASRPSPRPRAPPSEQRRGGQQPTCRQAPLPAPVDTHAPPPGGPASRAALPPCTGAQPAALSTPAPAPPAMPPSPSMQPAWTACAPSVGPCLRATTRGAWMMEGWGVTMTKIRQSLAGAWGGRLRKGIWGRSE